MWSATLTTSNPSPRGRKLWPKAVHVGMRFHDLRHTFATELLRCGVDVHRVQRLMRHSDVRVTTGPYGHLIVEDLRAAVDAHSPLPTAPGKELEKARARAVSGNSAPSEPRASDPMAQVHQIEPETTRNVGGSLEREARFELATSSLGS